MVQPNSLKNLKPIKPGEVRNPNGYEKGRKQNRTLLKKFLKLKSKVRNPQTKKLEFFTKEEQIFIAWMEQATTGNMIAIKEYLDRTEGKVAGAMELTGKDGQPLATEIKRTIIFKNMSQPKLDAEDNQERRDNL